MTACAGGAPNNAPQASSGPAHADAPPQASIVDQLTRLSLSLRHRRLSLDERARIAAEPGTADEVYERYLDRWYARPTLGRLFTTMDNASSFLFLDTLAVHAPPNGGAPILYAPSLTKVEPGQPPCDLAERVAVTPWWNTQVTVDVCRTSYHPDSAFDEVGYCAGRSEFAKPAPRPGCGCGPLLLACLPPESMMPGLARRMDQDLVAEVQETGSRILWEGRPYNDAVTTTKTWQTGLVRFAYLLRELLSMLAREPYSPAVEQRMVEKLRGIDLDAPGEWIERGPPYVGSGNYVAVPNQQQPTYRVLARTILSEYLCVTFKGVNVDRDNILATIGHQQGKITAFDVRDSPMRTQPGCRGCHAPLDFTAGFLYGLRTPVYGRYATGDAAKGTLYVHGAEDARGSGAGLGDLMRLVTAQPEFDECTVSRLYGEFTGIAPSGRHASAALQRYVRGGRNARAFVRAMLLSENFRNWMAAP